MFKKSLLALVLLLGIQETRAMVNQFQVNRFRVAQKPVIELTPEHVIELTPEQADFLCEVMMYATIAGTILYWVQREPNSVKINRVNDLWSATQNNLYNIQNDQELENFYTMHKHLDKDIRKLYNEITDRYKNKVTPWNWSNEMKNAYEKISFLHGIFNANHIISMTENPDKNQVIKHMNIHYKDSPYPLLAAVSNLKSTVSRLKESTYQVSANQLLINLITPALDKILSSSEYKKECELQGIDNLLRMRQKPPKITPFPTIRFSIKKK